MILFANVFDNSGTSPRADRTKLPIKVEEVEKKKKKKERERKEKE